MQTQDRPRFRQDLIAELVEDGGARFIDVVAPGSDNVFRFYEVEYSLACGMDGERDVAGIVKWATEELGVTPSPKEVQSVIATLVDLRFIDTGAVAAEAKVAKAAPTQPAKAPVADADLAKGVVVGATTPARAPAPAADLELGASGAKPQQKAAELPKAPDFDLGAPGAPPVAAPPRAPVEDIALGAPGSRGEPAKPKAPVAPASDIGIDLSAHMDVGAADVKDAVRKSKAMTAVDVPKELLEAEAPKAPEKQPAKQPEPVAAKGSEKPGKGKTEAEKKAQSERDKAAAAEKKAAAAAKAEQDEKDKQAAKAAPEAKAEKKADKSEKKADKAPDKAADKAAEKKADKKPAVELPKRPATDRPVAPPAPAAGVSPVLVVMLILAIVGAGTFFVWKFVLSDSADPAPKVQPAPKPLPPPPPVEVMSKIAVEAQPAQAVKSPVAGTIETIEADKEVKTGDVVAVLTGGKPLTTEIANLTKQIETATPALDAATKELEDAQQKPDNQAGVTAAQAKVDRLKKPLDAKKATLETKKADLDKLQIKATTDGKHTPLVKVGQQVAVDEQIAAIERPSLMVASFKVPPGTKMAADGNLSVVAGDKTIVCTVIDAQAETVKVSCPTEGLAADADVKFTLPK